MIPADGGVITDVVDYHGLTAGTQYTLTGKVMEKDASGKAVDTGITSHTTFTPTAADGKVWLDFTVPGSFAGKTLVVFEDVTVPGGAQPTEVAHHTDINSVPQTVTVAQRVVTLGTTATDKADGDKVIAATGGTVTDAVAYTGLEAGRTYTVSGKLVVDVDGKAVETGITGSKQFVATSSKGTVNVDFAVPASQAGNTLVAFEYLTTRDASGHTTTVGTHADLHSAPQTVTVKSPAPYTPPLKPTTRRVSFQVQYDQWKVRTAQQASVASSIAKEEQILYPMADRVVDPEDGVAVLGLIEMHDLPKGWVCQGLA